MYMNLSCHIVPSKHNFGCTNVELDILEKYR